MTIPNLSCTQEILDLKIVPVHELEKPFSGLKEPPATNAQAVDILARAGVLTPFQAQAVREGRAQELVMGNYIVLDKLGSGGMGAVYKARDRRMKRVAALKVLKKELVGSPDTVARFNREVEATAQCTHPGVVGVFTADEGPQGHYLAMEFVDGPDLAGLVMKRGPLPVPEALDCVLQAARALAYVHSKGLVHRDIKPANFLRDGSGVVKVADLGLVRITDHAESASDPDQESLTQAYTIAGTLEFMAPEQAMDTKAADHRADIYSLGCTLWYLLTGRNVYQAKSQMQKILAHQKEPIPSLCQARPEVPPALDAIFHRMVEKDPARRYQSMNEVANDLARVSLAFAQEQAGATLLDAGGMAALAAATPSALALPETDPVPGKSPTVIVVVESSDFLLNRMAGEVRSLGQVEVVKAKNLMQAQEALHDHPGVRLVIASNTLPDGSGVDLLRQMRAEEPTRDIPFMLATAGDDGAAAIQPFDKTVVISKKNFHGPHLLELAGQWLPLPAKPAGSMSVLIADDSPFARSRLENVVRSMGFGSIKLAKDGAEALEMVESARFDLIITDFNMPHFTGDAVARKARQGARNSQTPVMMYTSETDSQSLQAAHKAGVDKILPKNATVEDVQTSIRQLVRMG